MEAVRIHLNDKEGELNDTPGFFLERRNLCAEVMCGCSVKLCVGYVRSVMCGCYVWVMCEALCAAVMCGLCVECQVCTCYVKGIHIRMTVTRRCEIGRFERGCVPVLCVGYVQVMCFVLFCSMMDSGTDLLFC